MATISSAGIGSGLDVNSIVTQMVALEKKPLTALTTKATTIQSQITAFGTIQSQFSALSDVATRIAASSAWSARTGSSSNTSAATISVTSAAAATSFTLDVDALAKKQSISSATIAAGSLVGAGKLTFSLGTWSGVAASTAADAQSGAITAATAATTAGATAVSQVGAVKTALASFATAHPSSAEMTAYSTAYTQWASAVSANDHVTPALQTAENTALAARDTAYTALGTASPTLKASADVLAASATASANLNVLATSTPAVADYASKYSAWVAASAANDGVTPALQTAEDNAWTAKDAARAHIVLGAATSTSQIDAVKTTLTSLATSNPTTEMTVFSSAYSAWASAVAANDGTQTDKLAARDAAYTALGTASPTLQTTANDLVASATASANLATLAEGTTTVADYASKYSAWVAASAANDGTAAAAQTARDDARTALSTSDQAAADAITTAATSTTTALTAADAATSTAAATSTTAAASVTAWASAAKDAVTASKRATFAPSGVSGFSVDVTASDTVATLAAKINSANGGVVATAFFDGTNDRLLLSSKGTGASAGFKVQATGSADGSNFDNTGLSRMAFDPSVGAFGMASVGQTIQEGSDAKARINGLAVTSSTNTLTNNVPGVTISLAAVTTPTAQVTMSVSEDVTVAVKNIGDFIKAYNDLNTSLVDLTKYDAATQTGALFQGDSSIVGLQSILRSMVGSTSTGSSTYKRLSDVGVELQRDGSLTLNTVKLGVAANDGTELLKMFSTDNKNPLTNGIGIKFKELSHGVLATGGSVVNKATALQTALTRNGVEQTKVNDHVTAYEARLRKQYTALDTQMAKLTALNSYVAQQVTTWNKSTA